MALSFFSTLEVLKNTKRRGWLIRGIRTGESVGDHMYQMSMICSAYPWRNDSDRAKAIEMAIIHDAPEAIAGDVTPSDGISPETKHLREKLGLEFLACLLRQSGNASMADRMESLWEEYENGQSHISQIVHQVDKLDALQQAGIYAMRYPNLNFNDFKSHRKEITDPWLALQADEVLCKWDAFELRRKSDTVVIFVVGGPGVGKGTQCASVAEQFGFEHISVGDLLRAEQDNQESVFKEFISESIRNSVVVPAMLTMMLLEKRLENARAQGKAGVFLDGFPRSAEQLKAFEEQISNQYSTIVMDCPNDILLERLSKRAKSSGREDDNPESIRRRVETFKRSNEQILQLLSKNLLQTINCAGPVGQVRSSFENCARDIIRERRKETS